MSKVAKLYKDKNVDDLKHSERQYLMKVLHYADNYFMNN